MINKSCVCFVRSVYGLHIVVFITLICSAGLNFFIRFRAFVDQAIFFNPAFTITDSLSRPLVFKPTHPCSPARNCSAESLPSNLALRCSSQQFSTSILCKSLLISTFGIAHSCSMLIDSLCSSLVHSLRCDCLLTPKFVSMSDIFVLEDQMPSN